MKKIHTECVNKPQLSTVVHKTNEVKRRSLCKFGSEIESQCTPMRAENDCGECDRCPKWKKAR